MQGLKIVFSLCFFFIISKFANDYGKERIDSAVWRTEGENFVGSREGEVVLLYRRRVWGADG